MLFKTLDKISAEVPYRLAIVCGEQSINYKDLLSRASNTSALLQQSNLVKGAVVAIYMDRSIDAVCALIGVINAGGVYTIVEKTNNVAFDLNRLNSMALDYLIIDDTISGAIESELIDGACTVINYTHQASTIAWREELYDSRQPAYVLFTSGSSGQPKGVTVTHGNCAHYIEGIKQRLSLESGLAYVHVSTLAADLGNTALFLSLSSAGTLHLIPDEIIKTPSLFLQYINICKPDVIKCTPSYWQLIEDYRERKNIGLCPIKYLILGGEALKTQLVKKLWSSGVFTNIVNHYGPTEATVGASAFVISHSKTLTVLHSNTVPIGRPLSGNVFSLSALTDKDEDQGELIIHGNGVAAGYYNLPSQTAAVFGQSPLCQGRFYRTGDICRVDDLGNYWFLGRIDRQVKINGYRIELEQIESAFVNYVPSIEKVSVHVFDKENRRFLVAALGGPNRDEQVIRKQLAQHLPHYMLPAVILFFHRLPIDTNGKLNGKKIRQDIERVLEKQLLSVDNCNFEFGESLLAIINQHWKKYILTSRLNANDDFFDQGGDSIQAMQLISDLNVQGFPVTTSAFLKDPTIQGLANSIAQKSEHVAPHESSQGSDTFISSVQWFWQNNFIDYNHWNQAIVLNISQSLDANKLAWVLKVIINLHPMLSSRFYVADEGNRIAYNHQVPDESLLTVTELSEVSEEAVREAVTIKMTSVHKTLSVDKGVMFKVLLFNIDNRSARLGFVAHHLAMDAVSWRILLADIFRLYESDGLSQYPSVPNYSYWDWIKHIQQHKRQLEQDTRFWTEMPYASLTKPKGLIKRNIEQFSSSLWFSIPQEELLRIESSIFRHSQLTLQGAILAAIACAALPDNCGEYVTIDVESHGRESFDNSVDLSRVIGWFTAIYPLTVKRETDLTLMAVRASVLLNDVPHQGLAYGLFEQQISQELGFTPKSDICFNYLGEFSLAHLSSMPLSFDSSYCGAARGDANDRVHELKFTARKIDAELVFDVSFSNQVFAESQIKGIINKFVQVLAVIVNNHFLAESSPEILADKSSTGLLTYVPPQLKVTRLPSPVKQYKNILLTGASGFVGIHVLQQLLSESDATIYCLVRGRCIVDSRKKIYDSYVNFFPLEGTAILNKRVKIITGDTSKPHLGLTALNYTQLCKKIDAVYHFAADTRLFGKIEELQKSNVDSTREVLAFVKSHSFKELHYMSTLAIAGTNTNYIEFSEFDLNVGQTFLNDYERTKYESEILVRGFIVDGGKGFIYRSGNISGHSVNGRFQQNWQDNRFIQFIQAINKLGMLPRNLEQEIVFSPVDIVAKSIVKLSLSGEVPPGTFHVESNHTLSYRDIFNVLEELGFHYEKDCGLDFSDIFQHVNSSHCDELVLGKFWAERPQRNVKYNNDFTHRILSERGCAFISPQRNWLALLFKNTFFIDGFKAS